MELKLFNTAEKDLEAAISLYDMGQYPAAIFHLQQSVEKLVKSYGLLEEVIEAKDLKSNIGHLPHKVFVNILDKLIKEASKVERPLLLAELIPPHQRDLDKSPRLNFLNNTFNKLNSLTLNEMETFNKININEFISGLEVFDQPEFSDEQIFISIKGTSINFIF